MTRQEAEKVVGQCVYHQGKCVSHGNGILIRVSHMGCRISVWGGINGDKPYQFTVPPESLTLGHKRDKE